MSCGYKDPPGVVAALMAGLEYNRRANTTKVIRLGDRYFYKLSKGRVLTAWSLAGAKHFIVDDPELGDTVNKLSARNPRVLTCIIQEP